MFTKSMRRAGALAAVAVPLALFSQEQPLSIRGSFATGFYSTSTRGEAHQSQSFVPLGARFDVNGFYINPDFLSFSAVPEFNLGPQASEAGFQGGTGITFRVTLLGKSISPLTFRYSNVQVEDVCFGGLTQVSGYSLKNRNMNLGLTWQFKPKNLPVTTIDWGTGSVDSKPGIPLLSDYVSHGDHLNVDSKYERWGWDLEGFVHRQQQQSNLLASEGRETNYGSLRQTVVQYQWSGRRSFLKDSEFYADAGSQATGSLLFTMPVDLTTHYASTALRLFQRRRWKTSLRAGYSSNLASQLLAQASGTLGGPGSIAPAANILLPFSHGLSNFNLNGITSVTLGRGWGLYGSAERSEMFSSNAGVPLNANYFATSGGVTYARAFGWGSLSGEYGRQFGLGSITGESGRIQGQTYRISAQRGQSGGLVFDGTVHGSDQSVRSILPFSNHSVAVEGSVADRVARDFSARLGGGWQWGSTVNTGNQFHTNGYTARASLDHPRFQVSASLNNAISNSLPLYNELLGGLGAGSILLGPLPVVPSDYRAMSFSLHTNPLRKLEFSALWTHSWQHLERILANDFELLNVYLTYHFRRIQVEAGFIRFNQIFASYPEMQRQRFYVRISRTARIL